MILEETIERSAEISECGRYRWWLKRSWNGGNGKVVCFVMLNPSTADALQDDPTIRRCIGFAHAWGYSALSVRNLFALRATNPKELLVTGIDPIGGKRGIIELAAAKTADLIVAAWGANVPFDRGFMVTCTTLANVPMMCLGKTKNGSPRHPLYVRGNKELETFQ